MTRNPKALSAVMPLVLAAMLGACGDEPVTRVAAACEAPEGTAPFVFESGGRELFGFVDAPASPGPHPAILLIHDAGRTDVTRGDGDFQLLRDAFRGAGFATVVWDRAGSGCSAGRYGGIADLYLRADDVLAAAEALQGTGVVDAERIGAWAIGEGGWVAPMAAARGDVLKFLIIVGGPGRDPVERILHFVSRNLAREGYSEAEASEVVGRLRTALEMMRDRAPYRDYQAIVEPLARHRVVPPLSETGGDVFATGRRYDDIGNSAALHVTADVFLPAIEAPVLAIWGDRDAKIDWRESVRVYRDAFEKGGNPDLTIKIFEGADHEICVAGTRAGGGGSGAGSEAPEARGAEDAGPAPSGDRCRLAEGYIETMTAWLQANVLTDGAPRQTRTAPPEPADEPAR